MQSAVFFSDVCNEKSGESGSVIGVIGIFATVFIAGYILVSMFTVGWSYWDPNTNMELRSTTSVHEVSENLGLKSGEKYPLTIQDTFGESTENASATPGFFISKGDMSMKLDDRAPLDFSSEERGWSMTFPVTMIAYERATDGEAGAVINLENRKDSGFESVSHCTDRRYEWSILPFVRYENCSTPKLIIEDPTALSNLVSKYAYSAIIYLPPEVYDEMFK